MKTSKSTVGYDSNCIYCTFLDAVHPTSARINSLGHNVP